VDKKMLNSLKPVNLKPNTLCPRYKLINVGNFKIMALVNQDFRKLKEAIFILFSRGMIYMG